MWLLIGILLLILIVALVLTTKPTITTKTLQDDDWSACVGGAFCGGLCDGNCCANKCGGTNNSCYGPCVQAVILERDVFEFSGGAGIAGLAAACSIAGCNNL